MSEVRFYHLQGQAVEQALPALVVKAYQGGNQIVIKAGDSKSVQKLSDLLWTYKPDSFLPHGTEKEGQAGSQPIWITEKDENPNNADVLISLDGSIPENCGPFSLRCEMFDGRDEVSVQAARERWKQYKEEGLDITYWQQTANGGWDQKA